MGRTQFTGQQVLDGSVQRADLNTATAGSAVIAKLIAGTGVTLTSTGADAGTGDVTVNAAASASYPVTGTSAKSTAYTLGSTAGDTGKEFVLTGAFALTLPLASGGSASAPLWYHFSKRDGSGACTIVLSGSDTWEDGTTAAEYIYQEDGTLLSLGGGIWRFSPGTRKRGWVDGGAVTVSSGASAISISLGFNDPRIRDVQVDITNYKPSTSGNLSATMTQGGTARNSTQVTASGVANAIATVDVKNIKATTAYGVPIFTRSYSTDGSVNVGGTSSTTGSVTALVLTPTAGTITSATYNVKLFRP